MVWILFVMDLREGLELDLVFCCNFDRFRLVFSRWNSCMILIRGWYYMGYIHLLRLMLLRLGIELLISLFRPILTRQVLFYGKWCHALNWFWCLWVFLCIFCFCSLGLHVFSEWGVSNKYFIQGELPDLLRFPYNCTRYT
jgi:hypothetical protein